MLQNLIVALSNIPAIYPIYLASRQKDYLTVAALGFVGLASFTSHLVENHKHGMSGIGFSPKVSYILNRFDVLGCALVAMRFSYLYYNKYGLSLNIVLQNKVLFFSFLIPFIFLRISEHDKYNPKLKNIYIITHCLWHITIFDSMASFMSFLLY